jgi:hypothetical protein
MAIAMALTILKYNILKKIKWFKKNAISRSVWGQALSFWIKQQTIIVNK